MMLSYAYSSGFSFFGGTLEVSMGCVDLSGWVKGAKENQKLVKDVSVIDALLVLTRASVSVIRARQYVRKLDRGVAC